MSRHIYIPASALRSICPSATLDVVAPVLDTMIADDLRERVKIEFNGSGYWIAPELTQCYYFNLHNLDTLTRIELFNYRTDASVQALALPLEHPLRTALFQLAHYAYNKAEAIRLRIDGQVAKAMPFETLCERIYSTLPTWARW